MRYLFSLLIIVFSLSAIAQTSSCKDHHDGNFEIIVDGEVIATVVRSGGEQIEYAIGDNSIILYSVVWIDDCTQELRLKEVVQAAPDQVYISKEDVVTVKMDNVKSDSYGIRLTMKGSVIDVKGLMRVADRN